MADNSETCLIITGAPRCFIPPGLKDADFIIACDRGYKHAVDSGIVPDLVVGDFDSYPGEIEAGIEVIREKPEKDDTDTMIALRQAMINEYPNIVICGALGGRVDHEIANFALCAYAAERGARCTLVDEHHQIFAMENETVRVSRGRWTKISIFSMDRRSEGVTLRGLKYPLTEAELTNTYPLGVSNEFVMEKAEITVRKGMLLIVLSDLSF
ncbi:MAG: thiamine diphosphokinase [Anaerovoracaceae bacterium]|nr:thiamine diphosphokinase [Bacillota bacterium]MDY2670577.1 thiamine diphosphokinase [Anaerovoracaceae bacterium]